MKETIPQSYFFFLVFERAVFSWTVFIAAPQKMNGTAFNIL